MSFELLFLSGAFPWWILIIALVAFYLLKNRGGIKVEQAKAYLEKGAVVLDVRTQQEFLGGNVRGAVNISLDRVVQGVESKYSDRSTVLLCYCASGMRSGTAVRHLKAAGYPNSYNLGSFSRAKNLENEIARRT